MRHTIRWVLLAGLIALALGCVQPEEARSTPTDTPLSEVVDLPMCNRLTQSLAAYGSGRTSKTEFHQVVKGLWLQIAEDNRPDDDLEYLYITKGLGVIFDAGGEQAGGYISSMQRACVERKG